MNAAGWKPEPDSNVDIGRFLMRKWRRGIFLALLSHFVVAAV